jgi:hypothetical protein
VCITYLFYACAGVGSYAGGRVNLERAMAANGVCGNACWCGRVCVVFVPDVDVLYLRLLVQRATCLCK